MPIVFVFTFSNESGRTPPVCDKIDGLWLQQGVHLVAWPVSFLSACYLMYFTHRTCEVLRRGFGTTRLLVLQIRIPLEAWMPVCSERCVLSRRIFWDGPVPRPEESYRVCVFVCMCVTECDQTQQKPCNLQRLGRRGQTKKERRKKNTKHFHPH